MTSYKRLNRHSLQNSPYFCVRQERQRDQAKVKMESEIKERNFKLWKTDFEKENRISLFFSWSLEKTLKKKTILTIQEQKLTNNGFCDTKFHGGRHPFLLLTCFQSTHDREQTEWPVI